MGKKFSIGVTILHAAMAPICTQERKKKTTSTLMLASVDHD